MQTICLCDVLLESRSNSIRKNARLESTCMRSILPQPEEIAVERRLAYLILWFFLFSKFCCAIIYRQDCVVCCYTWLYASQVWKWETRYNSMFWNRSQRLKSRLIFREQNADMQKTMHSWKRKNFKPKIIIGMWMSQILIKTNSDVDEPNSGLAKLWCRWTKLWISQTLMWMSQTLLDSIKLSKDCWFCKLHALL